MLREAYEISYHIFNHDRVDAHPWALVLDRPQENYTEYGTLYRTVRAFRFKEVYKRFGLNLTEFLELPREYVELIMDICEKEMTKDSKTLANVASKLEEDFGK